MGYGDETNRPRGKTVRTFGTAYRPMQQYFLNVFYVQSNIISSITIAINNPNIIRNLTVARCDRLITFFIDQLLHLRNAYKDLRPENFLIFFLRRSRTRALELYYSHRGNSFLRSIRAPFSREALLTFCSCCEVVLSS